MFMLNPELMNKYSSSIQRVGTWKNGKPLYRVTIDFGQLPNNNVKEVSIPGTSSTRKIVKVDYNIINKEDEPFSSYANKIPFYDPSSNHYILCKHSEWKVIISDNYNASDHIASVDVYFWRTSD